MRAYKFRAYDKQSKKMLPVGTLTFFKNGSIAVNGRVSPQLEIMQ